MGRSNFQNMIEDNGFITGSERQIAAVLSNATSSFASDDNHRGHSVVLVTDGAPGCGLDACNDARMAASTLNQKGDIRILGLVPPASDAETCLRALTTGLGSQYDSADPHNPREVGMKLTGIHSKDREPGVHPRP